jgi:hypothetical protein
MSPFVFHYLVARALLRFLYIIYGFFVSQKPTRVVVLEASALCVETIVQIPAGAFFIFR